MELLFLILEDLTSEIHRLPSNKLTVISAINLSFPSNIPGEFLFSTNLSDHSKKTTILSTSPSIFINR